MSNSIGGNLETSIIMDASGVQQGADRGKAAMEDFAGSAARMGATLSGIGSETSALTSSLSNAAQMVELLAAKMVAAGNAGKTIRAANVAQELGLGALRNPADSHEMVQLRQEIEERNRFNAVRLRQAAELSSELASYARQEAVEQDRIRAETMAALRRDIEERSALARQRVTEQAAYARQEAADEERLRAETMAALRRDIEERLNAEQADIDARMQARLRAAQNSNTENPVRAMEDSILRMRAEMNPMVGMQARLAREATEFRQQMDLAVISGRINWQNAQRLTAEFQQQQALLMDQARASQAGFLGMRRMGFAAQQFGYAIEDAASVWGTMGMSGAFRAAGNNLTAMGAVLGPQVGVMASLAAAAVSLGISFYEAKKRAAELVEDNKRLKELTENISDNNEYRVGIEQDLQSARSANHQQLMEMYDETLGKLQEINAEEEARVRTNEQLAVLTEQINALKEIDRKISEDNAKWWREQFNWSLAAWEAVRDAGIGVWSAGMGLIESEEAARLAEERFNAETKITIEMNRQQAMLDRANSAEQKRLDIVNAQSAALQDRTRALIDQALSNRNPFDINNAGTMKTKDGRVIGNDAAMSAEQGNLINDRASLMLAAQDVTRSTQQRLNILKEIAEIEKEILRIDDMRMKLNEAGKKALEDANGAVLGRFEALNEELRIENEITRSREKTMEQIELAVRAQQIGQQQGQAILNDMEAAFRLEKDRRDNEKAIEELKKRESALESNARQDLTPGTTVAGLRRGSDEARAFLENERLRGMAAKDAEPTIAELKKVREEIKRLREANEKIGQSKPKTATIF